MPEPKHNDTPDIEEISSRLDGLITAHRAGRTPKAGQFEELAKAATKAANIAADDGDDLGTDHALAVAGSAQAYSELAAKLDQPAPRQAAPISPQATFGPSGDTSATQGAAGIETWQDVRTGKPVPVLSQGQSLASITPGASGLSLGRAIRGMITGNWTGAEREQALATNANPAGGYLVPDPLSASVIDRARNLAVLSRLGARVVPMESSTLRIARISGDPTIDDKVENESFSGDSLTFDAVSLTAHTLGQVVTISRELIDDAPNAAAIIENTLAQALAVKMDSLMLNGSGSAEPLGVMNDPNVQTTSIGGSLDFDDLLDALEDVMDQNAEPTGMVTTPLLTTALRKLKINSEANHYATAPAAIRDLLWLTSNQVDSGELYIGDFSQVLIGVRLQPEIQISQEAGAAFENFQTKIRVVWRGDVAAEHSDHLLKLTGATA